jgi:hypothetical protein
MIKKYLNTPATAVILSIIPGLALWLFHKNKQAAVAFLAFIVAAVLFLLNPSMIFWYLLSILYIGQMVYSAGLSVWQRPEKGPRKTGLNSNLAFPLPENLSCVKRLDEAVFEALKRAIRPDTDLAVAILGLDTAVSKYKFFGVTENHLVIAESSLQGDPKNTSRIEKPEVAWVSLEVGERNCLMKIKFEEEHYPAITLHIPSKIKKQAIEFVKEFPGTWAEDRSAVDVFSTIHTMQFQPGILVISIICLALVFFGISSTDHNSALAIIKFLCVVIGFFLLGWPYVIWLLRQIKSEPAFTSANFLRMFFIIPSVFYVWYLGVGSLGTTIINILEIIK